MSDADLKSDELLEALRHEATEPAARERVRARLAAAGALGGATAAASLAAAQSPLVLAKLGMLGKLLAVGAGVMALGTVAVIATGEPVTAPKPRPAVVSSPRLLRSVEPVVKPVAAQEPSEPTAPRPAVRIKTPRQVNVVEASAPPPAAPASTLADESTLLGEAVRALHAGQHERARALLEEHARRFPDGMLTRERQRAFSRLDAAHAP